MQPQRPLRSAPRWPPAQLRSHGIVVLHSDLTTYESAQSSHQVSSEGVLLVRPSCASCCQLGSSPVVGVRLPGHADLGGGSRITQGRFRECNGFHAAGRFPLIFLVIWVTRFPHPLGTIDVKSNLWILAYWLLRIWVRIPQCVPQIVKSLASLAARVVAGLRRGLCSRIATTWRESVLDQY